MTNRHASRPAEPRGRGDSLLRLLAGVSREELGDLDSAAAAIRRTVHMMAAYAVVAAVAVFFVSIPSFIDFDGGLHTANFGAFLWVGGPLFDCAALLVLSLYLGRSRNRLVGVGLVGVGGVQAAGYARGDGMADVVMLIACLMIVLHALQVLGILVFGPAAVRSAD